MILQEGEKIHVIHRRLFEKDIRRHFVGVVDHYEAGVIRAIGHVFAIENPRDNVFLRKPETRVRVMSIHGGNLLVNVLPQTVDLEKIRYEFRGQGFRVTDGSDWHLDIKEFGRA